MHRIHGMKKISGRKKIRILTAMSILGIAGSAALPVQAADNSGNGQIKTNSYIIAGGQANSLNELKNVLEGMNIFQGAGDCPVIILPGGNLPGTGKPETDKPETDHPGTDKPGTDVPSLPDTDRPGTDAPGENPPAINPPDTNLPEINPPDMNRPDTNHPDNNLPDTDTDRPEDGTQQQTNAERVVELVNEERAKAGLNPLALKKETEAAALIRAQEIVTSFSHTRPDGRAFSTVLTDNKIPFRGAGENIAWGQKTPEEVMNAWMNSDGHRANILNAKYTEIGVGYYQSANGRSYWTQLFTY